MNKRIIVTAALFGLLAVGLGAFGAHALKSLVSPADVATWQTGVQYQFYHTGALLFLSTFSRFRSRAVNLASWFFTFGILLFSGSIYVLATKSLTGITNVSFIGPLTPIGGVFFMLGWLFLLLAAIKNK